MSIKFLAAAALVALLCAPIVVADSKTYTGPIASTNCAGGISTGSACFKIPAGATHVAPSILDNAFGAEAGGIAFVTSSGGTPQQTTFCPGDSFDIPAGATRVIVAVADPAAAFQACGLVGAGTQGTMAVDFSSAPAV